MNIEPITIRRERDGKLFLTAPWPARAAISLNFLPHATGVEINSLGQIVLTFENAQAIYRLAEKEAQANEFAITVDLVECSFEDPPAPAAESEAA